MARAQAGPGDARHGRRNGNPVVPRAEAKEPRLAPAAPVSATLEQSLGVECTGTAFPVDDGESSEALERIDLSRFNMTRIVTAAYHSAFRPTAESPSLSEEDADEMEQIMVGPP